MWSFWGSDDALRGRLGILHHLHISSTDYSLSNYLHYSQTDMYKMVAVIMNFVHSRNQVWGNNQIYHVRSRCHGSDYEYDRTIMHVKANRDRFLDGF